MTSSPKTIPTLDALARATILAQTRCPRAVERAVNAEDDAPPETDQAIAGDALRVRGLQAWIPPDARAGAVLILRGHPLRRPGVAIVGARASDGYGLSAAIATARDAVWADRVVISGGAEGCDAAAHRAALEAGGQTLVVLGSGHDRLYPAHHRGLFAEIVEAGGTIASPYWPETPPAKYRFLARNRVIAALSAVVVVARARHKSGALSTAFAGFEMGRPVLAVPGSVGDALSEGGHRLLAHGAKPMTGSGALLRALTEEGGEPWPCDHRGAPCPWPGAPSEPLTEVTPSDESDAILHALREPGASDLASLHARTKVPIPGLLAALLDLELRGLVERSHGGDVRLR
jgi:DNA processing protein